MFKKGLILLALLILSCTVFSVRLIDPLSKELTLSDNFVGTVAPGNTMELIFSKELTNSFDKIVLSSTLPPGFDYSVKYEKESIKLYISVPKEAAAGDYQFAATFSGPQRSEEAGMFFSVVSGALDVSPASIAESVVPVDSPAGYKFFFVNNTDASAVFVVKANLPANWTQVNPFATQPAVNEFTVPKHQSLEGSFSVLPRLQGKKTFLVNVSYEGTSKNFSFAVNAQPTLKSKLDASALGLPFYSFSLLPGYFLNGLASFLLR